MRLRVFGQSGKRIARLSGRIAFASWEHRAILKAQRFK
jgi:hypothetical protein